MPLIGWRATVGRPVIVVLIVDRERSFIPGECAAGRNGRNKIIAIQRARKVPGLQYRLLHGKEPKKECREAMW
jgi:hypothetical protein